MAQLAESSLQIQTSWISFSVTAMTLCHHHRQNKSFIGLQNMHVCVTIHHRGLICSCLFTNLTLAQCLLHAHKSRTADDAHMHDNFIAAYNETEYVFIITLC